MKNAFLFGMILFSLSSFAQHTVVLKNGKKLSGVVMAIQDDVLSIAINRELKEFGLIEVSSIFFDEYVPYDGKLVRDEKEVKTIKSGEYTLKYVAKNREMTTAPKVSNGTNKRGTVVVDIVINQNGNVVSAKPGGIGSTTTSEYLYTKAQFAAKGARFNPDYKGPVRTEGYIEITY